MRRLVMDFQPVFMSGHSLKDFDSSHWQRRVRPSVVPASQAACSICAFVAQERRLIHADEVWEFSDPPHVALVEVRRLCTRCHEAKDYSHLLILIESGVRNRQREAEIRRHYCEVNACTDEDFDADLVRALTTKRDIEERYGVNSRPLVDYGQWARPKETPRLTADQQQLLKRFFDDVGETLFIQGRRFSTYPSAVKTMQEIPLDKRAPFFAEFESALDVDDGEFEMFPDHECPWDIKMARD